LFLFLFLSLLFWYIILLHQEKIPSVCFLHQDFPGLGRCAGQELNPAAGQHLGALTTELRRTLTKLGRTPLVLGPTY
jgi:hypothetical protein